jgi:sarcosine oxidase subunit beta
MTTSAEVVIVGAGVNGAAAAYHLVQSGVRDVLVIDRAGISAGMTGKSSSIVRQHYGHKVTAEMARDSLRFFQRFDQETGGHAEFKTTGILVFGAEKDMATMRSVVEMQRAIGIRTNIIGVEDVRALEPDMRLDDIAGACWEPDAGYADPVGTTAGFLHWAISHGARAWLDTTVLRVLTEGERVIGVETSRGTVAAGRVVLAAGPWIVDLALSAETRLPLKSSRHPILVFRHQSGRRPTHILWDLPQIMYTRPEGRDLTLVGTLDMAHSEEQADPDNYDEQPNFSEKSRWGEMLIERFPSYDDVEAMKGWCGIYEYTPDWHHIIDELPTARGCYVICGTSGHGFKLAPAVGEIVRDLVTCRQPAYDITDFRLDRFGTGNEVANPYAGTIIG